MDIREIIKEVHSKVSTNNLVRLYNETPTNKKTAELLAYKLFNKEVIWLNKGEDKVIISSLDGLTYAYYLKEFKENYNSGRLYSPTLSKLLPADSSIEDMFQLLMNIEGYVETKESIGLVEKTLQSSEESKDGIILVFYMDREMYENKELLNEYSQGVMKGMERIGLKGMFFFLPTDGEERIDCVNPKLVDAKAFEETKEKLQRLSMALDIELKN
jgi:hypothetical protein